MRHTRQTHTENSERKIAKETDRERADLEALEGLDLNAANTQRSE